MKHHILMFCTLLAVGFGAGLINGLLGAGGGILIVFALGRLLRKNLRDTRSIFATAVAVILPLSLLSALRYFQHQSTDLTDAALLLLPAVIGGATGALLLRRLSPALLSRIFAAVVLISGITMVL